MKGVLSPGPARQMLGRGGSNSAAPFCFGDGQARAQFAAPSKSRFNPVSSVFFGCAGLSDFAPGLRFASDPNRLEKGIRMLNAILAYHVENEVTSMSAEEDAALMVNLRKAHDRLNVAGRLGPAARLDVIGK